MTVVGVPYIYRESSLRLRDFYVLMKPNNFARIVASRRFEKRLTILNVY